jgi:hypothetical protein
MPKRIFRVGERVLYREQEHIVIGYTSTQFEYALIKGPSGRHNGNGGHHYDETGQCIDIPIVEPRSLYYAHISGLTPVIDEPTEEPVLEVEPSIPLTGQPSSIFNLPQDIIGQRVRVTNPGKTYTSYREMFHRLGFNNPTEEHPSFRTGTEVTIFNVGRHDTSHIILLALRRDDGEECLMSEDGVEFINDEVVDDLSDMMAELESPSYIGRRVRIVDSEHRYTTYSTMYHQLGFSNPSENHPGSPNGTEATVFNVETHPAYGCTMLAIRDDSGVETLINLEGVEFIDQDEPQQEPVIPEPVHEERESDPAPRPYSFEDLRPYSSWGWHTWAPRFEEVSGRITGTRVEPEIIKEQKQNNMEVSEKFLIELYKKLESPEKKQKMETLFPRLFSKYFELDKLVTEDGIGIIMFDEQKAMEAGFKDNLFMQVRCGGKFENKGFVLSSEYEWSIEEDDHGEKVLIPKRTIKL